ncbi:MAG: hypothetical protein A2998_01050 [Candidatus Staskawiczbacteria bacterium RIFCSPLOWO2_01_FULL_37_25b]|uniref:DOD-type homing endonuclease domain-containing protein n=1 Tax=Candidatus Staskawiczbacteria bacterium RIFCSPLOWO2_01_FULL_37_25b TaxID=1802213 RepID=A0A1G2I9Z7_9BACT|nr:MAG: hypothetical protein A2998_01050 [Candidatus Staskawiczbacteria bacterium RIFCSPLOWO2_01_FULL_37_25b]
MRILFKKGDQQKFIGKILAEIPIANAAKFCGLSERTIRDWRREKFLMNKDAMVKLCKATGIRWPKNIEKKDDFWYAVKGAKLGGIMGSAVCIKKYGCIGGPNRIKGWKKWWNTRGKFLDNGLFKRKHINKPRRSKLLAEFIGIMLGDGGISAKGKQIHITLNSRDDAEYIKYVCSSIEKLFKRKPGICKRKSQSVFVITVSSMDLIDYLTKLGLKKGNKIKLQVDIPDWIKNKRSYSIACVRGLIDTDGCIFNHRYKVNNKFYNYKKLAFACYSQPMRKSVFNILYSLNIKSRMFSYRDVRIDSQEAMKKYFKIIGTSNPKHLKRYYK